MKRQLLLLGVLAPFASPALAEGHSIGLKAGALGLGVDYGYAFTERLTVRAGLNGSRYGFDAEESDIEYELDLIWDSLSLGLDVHPLKSPFRISFGVLQNDNRLELLSRPTANKEIGDTTYTPSQIGTLTGRAGFDDMATYVGLGWDWSRKHDRYGMSFDFGLLDQGDIAITLRGDGTLLGDPAFQQDIAAEAADLEDEFDADIVPYATLGFVIRF